MRYTTLLIDVDGTLLDYGRAEAWALEAAFTRKGYVFSSEVLKVYQQINDSLWYRYEKGEVGLSACQTTKTFGNARLSVSHFITLGGLFCLTFL
ncbi:MAG TPA: hypothetical protein GX701_03280 [Clostridiales bacterium]|jgi:FMN phosphatase YigB (HAD superfamily)|nr:hypothetical protein [Clostridiales bacterium]